MSQSISQREMVTPGRRLTSGARVALLLFVLAGVAALGPADRLWRGARVTAGSVTGHAAVALGDSGHFASPSLLARPTEKWETQSPL